MPNKMSGSMSTDGQGWKASGHTIDVAKAAGFTFFRVMQPAGPIYGDIAFTPIESCSTFHASTSADTAELKQSIENWAIVANIESTLLFLVLLHVIRCDSVKKVDIFVCMELRHLKFCCRFRALDLVRYHVAIR